MKFSGFVPVCLCILLLSIENLQAQIKTETKILQNASAQRSREDEVNFKKLLEVAKTKGWQLMITRRDGEVAKLVGIDRFGYPMYVTVENNIRSASTIRTNLLWPGGTTGLSLNGSSANMRSKIAIWDGGRIRNTHVELTGRVTQRDNPAAAPNSHATHVAGTLIASGVNPLVKGMSFGALDLQAYDFTSDVTEMLGQANNLLISNHSYGFFAGWVYNADQSRWEYYGLAGSTEDYKFGYYNDYSMLFDSIAFNAPNYLIVTSAGNKHGETGPAVGQPYWRYNENRQMISAGNRPSGISSNDGYDVMSDIAIAKNILTVGSIAPIPNGFSVASDASISSFSSFGPTDDGRVKPDVVANGENLLSTSSGSDNDYAFQSGTSMSSPSAAGSLFLLQEHYSKLHAGAFMRAASLKGIAIHTADDAGNAGPDYTYGWGIVNMEKAAAVITANNTTQLILENNLANTAGFTTQVVASGKGQLVATLSWTDPKGVVETVNLLNNPAKKLINDLDIRIRRGTTETYLPFILDPGSPSAAATRGDNITDNVEKIIVDNTIPGETYTITVTHKGTLQRGQQAYSLIVSGVGGTAYCSSAPTATAGARIDSLSIGTLGFGNAAGCTSYSSRTSSIIPVEPNQTIPFFIRLGSCDATSAAKVAKIFIDYNNDGDFADAGETAAQSAVINATGNFTGTIITPASLTTGSSLAMRVIVQETSTANDVNPCGSYSRGETQDYLLKIASPSSDLGISDIVTPDINSCGNTSQYVSVRIKNFGTAGKANFPVTLVVRNGATVVTTINTVCPDSIAAFSSSIFTIPVSFNAVPGNTYSLTITTGLTGDQNSVNNAFASNVVVNASVAPSGATAEICGTTASLRVTASANDFANWYTTPTGTTPVATGISTTTTNIPTNRTYYVSLNEVPGRAGLPNRQPAIPGGYSGVNSFMNFTNDVPLTIENVRLYVQNPGRVTIILADSAKVVGNQITYFNRAQTTLNVYSTYAQNPANDTGAIFTLNLPVTVAGEHSLLIRFETPATLYRNNGFATSPYPVTLPGIMRFTGNSQADPAPFYYYYYDMGIKLANCPTARTAVVATAPTTPVVTLAGNVLTSSATAGNQWYLNGNPISGATGQTFTATASGIYRSIVTTASCQLGSNEVNFSATPVVDLNGSEIALIASPNPNRGQFYLQFDLKGKDDLFISLMNDLGQKVYSSNYPSFTGRFAQTIRPSGKVGPGMYLLKIEHNKKVYLKKLIVNN